MVAKVWLWRNTRTGRNSRVTIGQFLVDTRLMFRRTAFFLALIVFSRVVCAGTDDTADRVIISVHDQKLMLVQNGLNVATYPVSTSKFGIGDRWGGMTTPLGFLRVAQMIGDHAPPGAVFHNRRFTGEILPPNAPGRDPIITRIIWLQGLEPWNSHAFSRCIYIHGTPEEKSIGRPASYGCIRMKSSDVTALYSQLAPGAVVQILPERLPNLAKGRARSIVPPAPTKSIDRQMASLKGVEKPARPVNRNSAVNTRLVVGDRI